MGIFSTLLPVRLLGTVVGVLPNAEGRDDPTPYLWIIPSAVTSPELVNGGSTVRTRVFEKCLIFRALFLSRDELSRGGPWEMESCLLMRHPSVVTVRQLVQR